MFAGGIKVFFEYVTEVAVCGMDCDIKVTTWSKTASRDVLFVVSVVDP